MKVVHVSYSDSNGGAAIAARRHHEKMIAMGVESSLVVIDRQNNGEGVVKLPVGINVFMRKVLYKLFRVLYRPFGTWSFGIPGNDISEVKEVKEADVVILHWVNNWAVSLKSIGKFLDSGKRVVWFMHDMWPLTGGCHYSMQCRKFERECKECPHLGARWLPDIARVQFNAKQRLLGSRGNLSFVTPSRWLAGEVKRSALFGSNRVEVSPNPIDMRAFYIMDRLKARQQLGLPADRKLILFGADTIHSPYKGWKYIREIIEQGDIDADWVIYGSMKGDNPFDSDPHVHALGRVSGAERLRALYNAADVFVTPTLADNYPNVILEAAACGTPTVAFNTGGVPEMIEHGVTGYITARNEAAHLREGIEDVLFRKPLNREAIRQWAETSQRFYLLLEKLKEDYSNELINLKNI